MPLELNLGNLQYKNENGEWIGIPAFSGGSGGGTGGGGGSHYEEHTLTEDVEVYTIPIDTEKYHRYTITVYQPSAQVSPGVSFVRNRKSSAYMMDTGNAPDTFFFFEIVRFGNSTSGEYGVLGNVKRGNNIGINTNLASWIYYLGAGENAILVKGTTFAAGTKIFVRCWE